MDDLEGVPFPVATARELRRKGVLQVEALGRKLLVAWNGGRPSVFLDACPHLGLPLSMGQEKQGTIVCRYHAWTFSLDDGSMVEQPTLRRPQPCRLVRWGAMLYGDLVVAWKGDPDAREQALAQLPEDPPTGVIVHRVEYGCPFYLALFNAVDYAHFSFHTAYSPVYALYRRLRRDEHVPGRPFGWTITGEDDRAVTLRLDEAHRDLRMYVTCAEFLDDGGVNHFRTFATPIARDRTMYWECYATRSESRLVRAAAAAAFYAVIVPLLETEDRWWTTASTPNFLRGDNIHLSATDAPLGAHLRRFVLPRLEQGGAA